MRSPILSLPPRNMKVNAIPFPIIDAGALISSRFGPTMRHLAYTPFLNVLALCLVEFAPRGIVQAIAPPERSPGSKLRVIRWAE